MTNKDADKVVRWFQANYGMAEWTIKVAIGDPPPQLCDDLRPPDLEGLQGRCMHKVEYRTASIWINPAGHSEPSDGSETSTLIHELLHCFLASCDIQGESPLAEYAVNRLATVLEQTYLTCT